LCCRELLGLWRKRCQTGKTTSLKAKIKAVEAELDVTSIMLAREQAKYEVRRRKRRHLKLAFVSLMAIL
jgi:hypothetical protein